MARVHRNQVSGGAGNKGDYDFEFEFNTCGNPGLHRVEVIFAKEYPNDKGEGVSWRIVFGMMDFRVGGGGKKPVHKCYFNQDRPGPWSFMLKALIPDVIDQLGDGVEDIYAEQTIGRKCEIKLDWSTKDGSKLWVCETSPIGGGRRDSRPRDNGRDNNNRDDRGGYDRGRNDARGRGRDDDRGRGRDDDRGRGRDDDRGRGRDDDRGGYGQTYGYDNRDDRGRSQTADAMGVDTRNLPF
jgi:hypothetical protein